MRLQAKTIWIFLVTGLVMSLALYVALSLMLTSQFRELEAASVEEDHVRADKYFYRTEVRLTSQIRDWTIWDEPYDYAEGTNPEFPESNMELPTLQALELQMLLIASDSREVLASVLTNPELTELDDIGRQEVDSMIASIPDNIWDKGELGFVDVPGRPPLLIVARPIRHSDGSGPPLGRMLMGLYISDQFIEDMKKELVLDTELLRPETVFGFDKTFYGQLKAEGREWGWVEVDDDTVKAYHVRKDIFGNDLFITITEIDRGLMRQGRETVNLTLVALTVILLVFLAILIVITRYFVIGRISRLSRGVSRIGEEGGVGKVAVEGGDELSYLAGEINKMVQRQVEARKELIKSLHEVEEGKEFSERLTSELKKFKQAVDSASDAILIVDAMDNVIYQNAAVESILGVAMDAVLDKKIKDVLGLTDKMSKDIKQANVIERRPFTGEYVNQRPDGSFRTLEIGSWPMIESAERVPFTVVLLRDVTKLREADRLRQEFVAMASHQLKTPLTTIKWFSEMMMGEKGKKKFTAEQKEFLGQIYETNEKMISLVNDLLNVSHIETGRKFSIEKHKEDLIAFIEQAIVAQGVISAKKKVEIKLAEGTPGEMIVPFDRQKLDQAVQNLINNAIKYSPTGGKVTVGARQKDGEVIVSVTDNGIGIPTDQQPRIFEKFFRASNAQGLAEEGTGLGLFIVRAIVEGHGGRIWLESEENRGTTFYFAVPLE